MSDWSTGMGVLNGGRKSCQAFVSGQDAEEEASYLGSPPSLLCSDGPLPRSAYVRI